MDKLYLSECRRSEAMQSVGSMRTLECSQRSSHRPGGPDRLRREVSRGDTVIREARFYGVFTYGMCVTEHFGRCVDCSLVAMLYGMDSHDHDNM